MQVPINAKQTKSANVRFLWPTGGRHSYFVYTMKVLIFSSSEIVKTSSELISTSSELNSTGSELISTGSELIRTIAEQILTMAHRVVQTTADRWKNRLIIFILFYLPGGSLFNIYGKGTGEAWNI